MPHFEHINRLNSDINLLDKGVNFANDKVDEVISKIFDTDKQVLIVEGNVHIRREFNYFIDIINVTLDDKRIAGKKITLDNDVQINGDFYLSGNQILSGVIESDNWGASAGGQLDLANGTLKFGGSSDPNFSIGADGNIVSKGGTAAGFTINSTEGFYAGSGITRVQMKPGAGIWAGATAIGDAPTSLTNAGILKAVGAEISGKITLGANSSGIANLTDAGALAIKNSVAYGEVTGAKPPSNADVTLTAINGELSLTGGGLVLASGGAKIRGGQTAYNTGNGFWLGDVSGTTKFSMGSSAGGKLLWDGSSLKVGGWTVSANKISITGIDIDQANSRIKVYTGSNYVEMKPAGLFGYDSVLGTTVKIPTNGDAPEFSKGIIKEFIYELYTSGIIRTNANPAVNGGMLINNATMTGYAPASGGARFFVDYAGSNPGDVKIGDYTNSKGMFWDQSEEIFNVKGIFTVKGGTIENTLTMGASGKIDLGGDSELTKSHLYLKQVNDSIQLGQGTSDYYVFMTKYSDSIIFNFGKDGDSWGYIGITDTYSGKFIIGFSQVQMAATITGINVASNKWTFSDNTSVIGGVTASNLLDKSAAETISAKYTFSKSPAAWEGVGDEALCLSGKYGRLEHNNATSGSLLDIVSRHATYGTIYIRSLGNFGTGDAGKVKIYGRLHCTESVYIDSGKVIYLDGTGGNVRIFYNAGANTIDFYIGGQKAGHIDLATGFVND